MVFGNVLFLKHTPASDISPHSYWEEFCTPSYKAANLSTLKVLHVVQVAEKLSSQPLTHTLLIPSPALWGP